MSFIIRDADRRLASRERCELDDIKIRDRGLSADLDLVISMTILNGRARFGMARGRISRRGWRKFRSLLQSNGIDDRR
jgi:hypothetical protein